MTETLPEVAGSLVPSTPPLSKRQREILQTICDGKNIHSIALDLCFSENTVKYRLKLLFKQLHVHNRTRLVHIALKQGWVK